MGCIQNDRIIQILVFFYLDLLSFSSVLPDFRCGGSICCYGVDSSLCYVSPRGFLYSCGCIFYQAAPIFPVQASSLWSGASLAGRFFVIDGRVAMRKPFFGRGSCSCLGGLRLVFPFRGS